MQSPNIHPTASPHVRHACAVASLCFALMLGAVSASAASQGSFERTLKVTGNVNLEVTTGSGNIEVKTGSSDEVRISGRIRVTEFFGGNADNKIKQLEDNPPIQQNGNEIRVGHIEDPELRHNVSISYELIVPADTQLRAKPDRAMKILKGFTGLSMRHPDLDG